MRDYYTINSNPFCRTRNRMLQRLYEAGYRGSVYATSY